MMQKILPVVLLVLLQTGVLAQATVTRTIKSFGAKGNGRTNDTEAFARAAAFFNARQGNGKLIIGKGTYIVGKQIFNKGEKGKPAYSYKEVLLLKNNKHLLIQGEKGSVVKYAAGLRFGSFDPVSGKAYLHKTKNFLNRDYEVKMGYCFYLVDCDNITISNIRLHGNNTQLQFGGAFGDTGIQIPHSGIFIEHSRNITIDKVNASYFALDGISVANIPSALPDNISILNSSFEYNSRQGFSWVGGNGLLVKNCSFNYTGKARYCSPPGAGIDIEAEAGPIRNGVFDNCSFIDNTGCGLLAESGDLADCSFANCTFWGTNAWSAWVTKPGFNFTNCKFYGSIVHGYNSPNDKDATRFSKCLFEDKPYKGKTAYGSFLIETNGARRMSFDSCTMIAHTKKIMWMDLLKHDLPAEEKYSIYNCTIIVKGAAYAKGDFVTLMRGVKYKNNTISFEDPAAKDKGYWPHPCCVLIDDLGGNTTIYKKN